MKNSRFKKSNGLYSKESKNREIISYYCIIEKSRSQLGIERQKKLNKIILDIINYDPKFFIVASRMYDVEDNFV